MWILIPSIPVELRLEVPDKAVTKSNTLHEAPKVAVNFNEAASWKPCEENSSSNVVEGG